MQDVWTSSMTEEQSPSYDSLTQNILHELAREVRPKKIKGSINIDIQIKATNWKNKENDDRIENNGIAVTSGK